MTVLRAGSRFRLSDPMRGACGDCPGIAENPPPAPTVPIFPPGADGGLDVLILDGFEHDPKYVQTDTALYQHVNANFQLVPGRTGGRALRIVQTPTLGDTLTWPHKSTGQTYQYMRANVLIESFANANGFARSLTLLGWVDSTGFRYYIGVNFPGAGGLGTFYVANDLPGGGGKFQCVTIAQVNVWYRLELVTELLADGTVFNTVSIALVNSLTALEVKGGNVGPPIAMGGFPFVGPNGTAQTGNALTLQFDDVRIQTARAAAPVLPQSGPFWGAGGVWPLQPAGPSVSGWTPLAGLNYTQVDEFPPVFDDDGSYVSSAGLLQLDDVYAMAPSAVYGPIPAGGITAVQVRVRCTCPINPPSPSLAAIYRDPSGTVFQGTAQPMVASFYGNYPGAQGGTTRFPHCYVLYPDPLSTVWQNTQGMGVRRIAGVSGAIRVTDVWGWMDVRAAA